MIRGFVLDVDGVLIRGKIPLNAGVEALTLLRQMSIPFLLCTNGGGCTERVKANYLSRLLQFEIQESEVCVSHTPFRILAEYYSRKPVLVIGRDENETREVAMSNGLMNFFTIRDISRKYPNIHWQAPDFQRTHEAAYLPKINHEEDCVPQIPKFSAVLVLIDPGTWSLDIQILCDVLRDGEIFSEEKGVNTQIPLYISNLDYLYTNEFEKPRFGTGCFVKCLEELYLLRHGENLKYELLGKPSERMCRFLENKFLTNHPLRDVTTKDEECNKVPETRASSLPDSVIYMIGDNPETDVRMASVANGDIVNDAQQTRGVSETERETVEVSQGTRTEQRIASRIEKRESNKNVVWKSVLVKTGVAKDNNHPLYACRADYFYEDVREAVRNILHSHGFNPN